MAVCACAQPLDEQAIDETPDFTNTGGKADDFSAPQPYVGACAADSPSVPYQPVPVGTRAQPDGPEVLHTRIGVPISVRYGSAATVTGSFQMGDCGRHYFVFTLDRASRLTIGGSGYSGASPVGLSLCFEQPHFLRIDTPWYNDIWQKDEASMSDSPCESFVPVGNALEPSSGSPTEFAPGTYELTIDPEVDTTDYELQFEFTAIGDAVCGDGVRDAGEACDDGNQLPLDWCGADCRPQRLDVEPIAGNESRDTAQPLDGFRIVNFYASSGGKEVDVYSLDLAAGESVQLSRGERACDGTWAQLFSADGTPLEEPWDCASDEADFTAGADGTYFLRFETAAGGSRSVQARLLP